MTKKYALVVWLLLTFVPVFAQQKPAPQKYLWIQYEQLQPGKTQPYLQLQKAFLATVADKPPYWITGGPMVASGEEHAAAFLTFMDDFADMERIFAAFNQAGEELTKNDPAVAAAGMGAVTSIRSLVAELQPNLSLNLDKFDPARATRWDITTYRLRPGTRQKFGQLLERVAKIEAADNNQNVVVVYRLVAGAPGPVYLVMRPLKTLADLDQKPVAPENAARSAVLGEQFAAVVGECVLSQTEAIYVVLPNLSHVPASYVATNPDFWTVKPEPVAAIPAKKAKKPAQPAAMRQKN